MSTPRDPGVQPERTRLAWRRTTLAFTVAAVLLIRGVVIQDVGAAAFAVAAVAALAWVLLLVVAHRRVRQLAVSQPAEPDAGVVRTVFLCTAGLAALGWVLLW